MLIAIVIVSKFAYYNIPITSFMEKEPILLLFGHNVQQARKKEISQEKLAELAGVHRTYIGMIERAEKNITLCNIERIAKALKVEIKDLLEPYE